jgi:hypothetical protein
MRMSPRATIKSSGPVCQSAYCLSPNYGGGKGRGVQAKALSLDNWTHLKRGTISKEKLLKRQHPLSCVLFGL